MTGQERSRARKTAQEAAAGKRPGCLAGKVSVARYRLKPMLIENSRPVE
jgi:hypothetical protein